MANQIEFDAKGQVVLPRLTKGTIFGGPEYYGCMNTGRRPAILRDRVTGRYIVGAHMDVEGARERIFRDTLNKVNRRIYKVGEKRVYAFKGRKAAVAKFTELCRAVMAWNEKTREAHRRDLEAAKRGDMEAAMRLSDY
jgi:hypothetical protein